MRRAASARSSRRRDSSCFLPICRETWRTFSHRGGVARFSASPSADLVGASPHGPQGLRRPSRRAARAHVLRCPRARGEDRRPRAHRAQAPAAARRPRRRRVRQGHGPRAQALPAPQEPDRRRHRRSRHLARAQAPRHRPPLVARGWSRAVAGLERPDAATQARRRSRSASSAPRPGAPSGMRGRRPVLERARTPAASCAPPAAWSRRARSRARPSSRTTSSRSR